MSAALLAYHGIEPGVVVGILASWGGLWFLNACRIVYVLDEISPVHRVGFAYGTLPGHAERGEERFSIEWHSDDTVRYDLLAFSRPGHWLIWLGYPCIRCCSAALRWPRWPPWRVP